MGALNFCLLSAMSIKFLVLGGGFWVSGGGARGSADFISMGAGIFLIHASFFPFCPLRWPPLCHPGWASPQSSGRKFLPEICAQERSVLESEFWSEFSGFAVSFQISGVSFGVNLA